MNRYLIGKEFKGLDFYEIDAEDQKDAIDKFKKMNLSTIEWWDSTMEETIGYEIFDEDNEEWIKIDHPKYQ